MQWEEYDATMILTLGEGEAIEIPKNTPIKLRQNHVWTHEGFVAGHGVPVKTGWPDDWQKQDATAEAQVTRDDRSL
jgi:hypothetical protein